MENPNDPYYSQANGPYREQSHYDYSPRGRRKQPSRPAAPAAQGTFFAGAREFKIHGGLFQQNDGSSSTTISHNNSTNSDFNNQHGDVYENSVNRSTNYNGAYYDDRTNRSASYSSDVNGHQAGPRYSRSAGRGRGHAGPGYMPSRNGVRSAPPTGIPQDHGRRFGIPSRGPIPPVDEGSQFDYVPHFHPDIPRGSAGYRDEGLGSPMHSVVDEEYGSGNYHEYPENDEYHDSFTEGQHGQYGGGNASHYHEYPENDEHHASSFPPSGSFTERQREEQHGEKAYSQQPLKSNNPFRNMGFGS